MASGDPRKQQRTDQQPVGEVTKVFPPSLSAVVTQIGAAVVPFPGFNGGKAIDMQVDSGDLQLHLHIPPESVETVIEELRQAKMKAETGLVPASLSDMQRVANGNGGGS